ncbi:NO signaling/Golgi transport ligand-binding domain-containing protein [Mucor lusitanicus]|nr:NO signaling/Golgi transport ligand-binding domain-containing protein [Mucor lusitanicus]
MSDLPPRPSMQSSVYSEQRITRAKSILEKNLNKSKGAEVSLSAQTFLFSEMLQYAQKRVNGIQDLERKLNEFGYRVGSRVLELLAWREKVAKREIKVINVLYFIHSTVWKALFGKQADSLEKSTENEDEYMISDNEPVLTRYISVPKELSQLNCNAFVAGIVEAVLDGCQFPARVTAHTVPQDGFPQRTTILIKLDQEVLEREELLK